MILYLILGTIRVTPLLLPRLGCRRVEELQEGGREGEGGGVARGLLLWLTGSTIHILSIDMLKSKIIKLREPPPRLE